MDYIESFFGFSRIWHWFGGIRLVEVCKVRCVAVRERECVIQVDRRGVDNECCTCESEGRMGVRGGRE